MMLLLYADIRGNDCGLDNNLHGITQWADVCISLKLASNVCIQKQCFCCCQDPPACATLLAKLKTTMNTVQEVVKARSRIISQAASS